MASNLSKKNHNSKSQHENQNQFFSFENISKIILICGESLALFFIACYLFSIIGFWINIPIIQYSFLLSFLIATIFGFFQLKQCIRDFWVYLLIVILCIAAPPAFTSHYYDFGYDSNVFHEIMVISLSNGQNPILNPDIPYLNQTHTYSSQLSPHIKGISDWVTSKFIREAKGYHILAAAFYSFTKDLQASKSITIIGSFMSIFLCFALFSYIFEQTPRYILGLLSIVAGINSIVICSSLSFYVDGFLYASLLSLMALFGLYYVQKRIELLCIALAYSALLINIKSTAIIFVTLLYVTIGILYYLNRKDLLKRNLYLIIPFIILCALCSYHPYIHNYIVYNDISGGSIDEANNFNDIPNSWKTLSIPEKLILSLFSKADVNPVALEYSVIKIPLLDISDAGIYSNDPPKVGGWGPLFSGILILSLLFFIWQIQKIIMFHKIQENSIIFLGFIGMIIITVLIFQLSWYARYVPQLALLPVLMILPYVKSEKGIEDYIRIGLTLLLVLNILMVGHSYLSAQQQFTGIQNDVFSFVKEKAGNTAYILYDGDPHSSKFVYAYVYDLFNKGIKFEVNPIEVKNGIQLPTIISRDFVVIASVQGV